MFERISSPKSVLAFRLSGKVSAEDIAQYKAALEPLLKSDERLSVCVDLTGLTDMTADALVQGMKADLEWVAHLDRLGRVAIDFSSFPQQTWCSHVGPAVGGAAGPDLQANSGERHGEHCSAQCAGSSAMRHELNSRGPATLAAGPPRFSG